MTSVAGIGAATEFRCPKHMEFGPCGGVGLDGSCEIAPDPCVFLDRAPTRWSVQLRADGAPTAAVPLPPEAEAVRAAGEMIAATPVATSAARRTRELLSTRPIVVADFPGLALDAESFRRCAAILAGSVDATLSGDSGEGRVQFSPSLRAQLIAESGLAPMVGLNCRDRNTVALEGELASLAEVGVALVHVVTGDHTNTGNRPDAKPVFDLDSTRLAALASRAGHVVSVAEAPSAPPIGIRPQRLVEKLHAGAEVCFVNHCGGVDPVRRFIDAVHDLGESPHFIPCVPVIVDRGSAELLRSFPGLVLPEGYLEPILSAADPHAAGLDAAVRLCEQLLAVPGVSGVDLSGGPSGGGSELAYAEDLAEIGRRLGLGG